MRRQMIENRRDGASDAAFHVYGAAPIHLAARDLARKWWVFPHRYVPRWNDVGVAGEDEIRHACADPGVQIFDVVDAGLTKRHAMNGEAGGLQRLFEIRKGSALGRRYRRTAQQIAGDGDGIGGHLSV